MRRKLQTVGWIATLLCCAVLWTVPAMAEEVKYELWIAGKQLTSENCTNISKDNGFLGVTVAEGGKFSYDKANNKLLIKDVTVDSKELDAIKHQIVDLTIEVEGTNTLNAEGKAKGLFCLGFTKLEGKGSLTITVKNIGIFSDKADELSISDITLNISGQWGISGGLLRPKLTINNAIVIAKGEQRAMDDLADLSLSNCAIVTPEVSEFRSGSIVDINADKWATKVEIAPTYGLYIAGKQVHALNYNKIDKDHGFTGVTIADGGECRYDKEKNTLFMKDVTIAAGDNQSAVMNYNYKLLIKVEGTNRWSATNRAAFFNRGVESTISGEEGKGKLEVTSKDSAAVFVHKTTGVHYIDFTATGKWGVLGKDRNDQLCNLSLHTAKGKLTATSTEEAVSAIMNLWSFNDDNALYVEPRRAICIYESTIGALIYTAGPDNGKKIKVFEFDRKYPLTIGRRLQVDAENYNKLVDDPNFPTSGITVGSEGYLRYDPATKTLFMKDVTIDKGYNPLAPASAIYSYVDGLTIKIEGVNTLDIGMEGIFCGGPTQITGDGSLTIKSGRRGIVIDGKPEYSPTTISNITLDVQAPEGFLCYTNYYTTSKCICNNIKATVRGPLASGDYTLKGCKIVSAEGASPIEIDRIRVESLSFKPAEITRYVGDAPEAEPMPEVTPAEAGNKKLAWTSDNEEAAKVEDGKLIIGTKGTALLTATTTDGSNQKAQLTVHVRYRVDGVKLYQNDQEVSELTLTEGGSVMLTAKVAPANVPSGVEWAFQEGEFSVKDKTSEKATFTALKAGDYAITARAVEDNEKTATVTVKVLPKVASLTLHEKGKTEAIGDVLTFEIGESKTFEVKQLPAEALPLPVSWSVTLGGKPTEDVTVAEGVVTVKKWVEGCTLTVQVKVSESETVKKEVTLTVLKPAPKEIKLEPKELTLAAGETKEVTISFVGDAPLDEGVTVEPATSDYITIKQEGNKLSLTGKKPTTEAVTLTVTSTRNTTVKESCKLTVTKAAPTTITIAEEDKAFALKKDESKEITLGFTPAEYVDNEVVVTVTPEEALTATAADGKLTIKADKPFDKETTVTVTVTSKVAPTVSNSCTVTVTKTVPTAIIIAEKDKAFALKKDESKEITLGFTPAEYVNNEVVVTVTPEGALTATAVDGKLTIKADKPFDKETTVEVTVTSKVAPTVSDNCKVTLKYEDPGAVEDVALARIAVAPNPFSTELRIENPEGIEGYYELLTAAGVAVRSGALDVHKVIVNTEALPAGVYFLHIRQGELLNTHKTVKVVKN